jgi:transposase-like protein
MATPGRQLSRDDQERIRRMAQVASLRKTAHAVGVSVNTVQKYRLKSDTPSRNNVSST